MKQVLQNLKNGEVTLAELPVPNLGSTSLLIQTRKSLISLGTEKMLLNFGKSGWIKKARQQPDKVKQVFEKMKTEGVAATISAVQNKLDQPIPLGYSNVGRVVAVGKKVTGFKVGDRVVSNGNHAELVAVAENLCCKIPDNVADEEAVFTVVSAIGLQGVRLLNPTLGETVVVLGLGLIGIITCQLLKANGVKVIGLDIDPKKIQLATNFGITAKVLTSSEDIIAYTENITDGVGVDGVIITASADSNQPIELCPKICRKRGRVILVGVVGLNMSRADFYEKEITFQVSCSYGPGRYDPIYEKKGLDYPIGHVRWTENRNFSAILDLISNGGLNVKELISKEYDISEVEKTYDKLLEDRESLGIIINYSEREIDLEQTFVPMSKDYRSIEKVVTPSLGVVGSGNFTNSTILPALKKLGVSVRTIASSTGIKSFNQAKKHQIEILTSKYEDILADSQINSLIISTPHNLHAEMASKGLINGKAVYLEKPLAITKQGQLLIESTLATLEKAPLLTIGFNRRFSPFIVKMKELLEQVSVPKSFIMTVNAGNIPSNHWTQDLEIGGGRLLGECCHFIDLLRFLAKTSIINSSIEFMNSECRDTFTISLKFEDGSIGTILYFSNGHKGVPKERLEVFAGGKVLVMDNFRKLTGYGFKNFRRMKSWTIQKGHLQSLEHFFNCIKKGEAHIPLEEIFEVSRVCLELSKQ